MEKKVLDAFSVQEFLIFWEVARRVIQFSNKAQILFFECFLTYDDNKYYIIKHIDITVYWEESGSSDILPKSNINWPKENEKKKYIGQFLILADFSILALFFKFQLNKILLKI